MAFLSEILNESPGIPPKFKEQSSICLMCGEKVDRGGMWATQELHTCVCEKCAPSLLDWYIDTLLDTKIIDENDDITSVTKLSNAIIERYKSKKQKKIEYKKKHI